MIFIEGKNRFADTKLRKNYCFSDIEEKSKWLTSVKNEIFVGEPQGFTPNYLYKCDINNYDVEDLKSRLKIITEYGLSKSCISKNWGTIAKTIFGKVNIVGRAPSKKETETSITYGLGGAHFGLKKFAEQGFYANIDVSSMYPTLAMQYGARFNKRFKDIYDKKMNGDNSYKLLLNSTIGMISYSDKKAYRLIIQAGQSLISEIVAYIESFKFKIIQVNTDSVMFCAPKRFISEYGADVCKQATMATAEFCCDKWNMSKEYFDYIAQRDVNSYIARKLDGTFKVKGFAKNQPKELEQAVKDRINGKPTNVLREKVSWYGFI